MRAPGLIIIFSALLLVASSAAQAGTGSCADFGRYGCNPSTFTYPSGSCDIDCQTFWALSECREEIGPLGGFGGSDDDTECPAVSSRPSCCQRERNDCVERCQMSAHNFAEYNECVNFCNGRVGECNRTGEYYT